VRTPLAASGLAVTMLLAALTHVGRREPGAVAFTVVLMLVAAFVSWGASDLCLLNGDGSRHHVAERSRPSSTRSPSSSTT
jgi:hypothetical protein